jgi:alpha-amylase
MLQYFHWYLPPDISLWKQVGDNADAINKLGINAVWLPPAYKGISGGYSIGYDTYDLFDLGEFDQKGSIGTKYGTKKNILMLSGSCMQRMSRYMRISFLNHKGGADEKELIQVIKSDSEDRTKFISEPFDIEAYTKFTFPGRKNKYSDFIWDHRCFSGVDYDDLTKETAIYSIVNEYGDGWEEMIDIEKRKL